MYLTNITNRKHKIISFSKDKFMYHMFKFIYHRQNFETLSCFFSRQGVAGVVVAESWAVGAPQVQLAGGGQVQQPGGLDQVLPGAVGRKMGEGRGS